jgi:two-component system, OmpR family, sensor histidine kinase PrrB
VKSLRARVALAAVAAAAIVVAIASGVLIATAGRDDRRDLDRQLEQSARGLLRPPPPGRPGAPGEPPPFPGFGEGIPEGRLFAPPGSDYFRVVRAGEVVAELGDAPQEGELPVPDEPGFETVELDGESWRVFTPPERAGPFGVQIQAASSLEPIDDRVANRRRLIVLLGLGGLAVAGGLGLAFGGVALRPLGRLRTAAAGVGSTGDLSTRVPVEGPEEVEALAQSLNSMLAKLQTEVSRTEAALEASRRFAADAGHELRTPLTSMSANLDAMVRNPDLATDERRAALEGVRSELARFSGVLDALQDLARGDAGVGQPPEEVDLAELAEASAASLRWRHPRLELEFPHADGPVPYTGSPAGLRLVLDNLLENAAVHGSSRASLRIERHGHGARLIVDDDGPGIPEDEREKVFGRFERGRSPGGQGSGLGLAIVAQQAARHGGSVRVSDSPLGGARFEVDLGV